MEGAALVGAGTSPFGSGLANPLLFGVGGRVGAAFHGIYAGVSLEYDQGASGTIVRGTLVTLGGGSYVGTIEGNTTTILFGGELGYDLKPLPLLTIRPRLGFGNADFQLHPVSAENVILRFDTNDLYLEPGVVGLLSFGHFIVGVDANVLFLPTAGSAQAAVTAHAQAGVRF